MTELQSNSNYDINGYGASIKSSTGNFKSVECMDAKIDKGKFQLFGQNNLMYDKGTTLIDSQQRLGPGRYELDNMHGCNCELHARM